jgi:uncharacterized integral membrane protein
MGYPDDPTGRRDVASGADQSVAGTGPTAPSGPVAEKRGARAARKARRASLFALSFVALAILVFLVALIASNTRHVTVSWVFGTSRVSLVWLVVFTAILGWVLGLLVSAIFRWRTRRRDPQHASGTSADTTAGR